MAMRDWRATCAAVLFLGASVHAAAAEIRVAASIRPVHSLVAGVMSGVGEPGLIVSGGGSPHAYSLKPSEARTLERADLVFWIGEGLETFLKGAIEGLAADARVVALATASGIELLEQREGGVWADHDHGDEKAEEPGHSDHDHEAHNLHVWLDPANARAIVRAIAVTLAEADPANKDRYQANAERMAGDLEALEEEMRERLAPVRDKPFIVFHDAYAYLERRFGLNAVGSIALNPEIQTGAARLSELQHLIEERGAACVFAEPQFEPRLVALLIEGTDAKSAVLDPLGAGFEAGPGLYFDLMRSNSEALVSCLSQER